VAIKLIDPETMDAFGDLVAKEVAIWSALGRHPHLAALKEVYQGRRRTCFVSGAPGTRLMQALQAAACCPACMLVAAL
jgi:hypothetical protein